MRACGETLGRSQDRIVRSESLITESLTCLLAMAHALRPVTKLTAARAFPEDTVYALSAGQPTSMDDDLGSEAICAAPTVSSW